LPENHIVATIEASFSMEWYYGTDGQRNGPISESELEQLVAKGVITPATLVWRQGMTQWQQYGTVSGGGAPASPGDDTAICAFSGKTYPKSQMIQYEGRWISAEHRDEYFQRLREGVSIPGRFSYGGFWIRFGAKFLDGIILGLVGFAINFFITRRLLFGHLTARNPQAMHKILFEFQAVSAVTNICLAIIYAVFFISRYSATPGKMAVGLKLVRSDGSPLSTGRIIGRYFSEWLSSITLMIGYIMAGFDEEKRALHDRICDTRVIRAK
jgi:uncharacterized RDD family membrane protein YckC